MTTQLTLGGLIEALEAFPQDAIVKLAGFGSASTPGPLFRNRRFMDGLAITPATACGDLQMNVAEFADSLRRTGPGLTWSRPVGGRFSDKHPAGLDTPLWASTLHEVSFHAVTGVEMKNGFAVIRTTDMAPVQGPSLQRLTDDEVINRMRVEHLARCGEDLCLAPAAERYLIRYIPKDRTAVLQRLAEAREELAGFEASLQAKRDRVAKLEQDAARHDYLLGIRDDLPVPGAG